MIQSRLNYKYFIRKCPKKLTSNSGARLVRYASVFFSLIFILFENISAQNGSIRNLDVFITEDQLNVSCHFTKGFIDEDMRQTLSSGMSSTFNFQINLKYKNGSTIRSQLTEVAIRYDIWEKQYLLFYSNQILQFSDYPEFESFLCDSLVFGLGPVKGIDSQKTFQVIVFFSPEKISSSQKEKLNFWLTSNADTEESAPGIEQESGFSIDLSKLFSIFLSNKPKTKIQQYKSNAFRIENLRKNEKPAQ